MLYLFPNIFDKQKNLTITYNRERTRTANIRTDITGRLWE